MLFQEQGKIILSRTNSSLGFIMLYFRGSGATDQFTYYIVQYSWSRCYIYLEQGLHWGLVLSLKCFNVLHLKSWVCQFSFTHKTRLSKLCPVYLTPKLDLSINVKSHHHHHHYPISMSSQKNLYEGSRSLVYWFILSLGNCYSMHVAKEIDR